MALRLQLNAGSRWITPLENRPRPLANYRFILVILASPQTVGFMKILLKPIQLVYWTYAALLFVCLMLLVFPIVVLASFFGRVKGGNTIYAICRIWGGVWMFLIGISHRNIYETAPGEREAYIFVANHVSYMDIPVIFKAIRKRPVRVLGKAEMKSIPIFGFIYSRAVVMVDRKSSSNRAKSVRQSKSILGRNISIFIYPEGTFNETGKPLKNFYDGAFRIAIETRTPIMPVLFLDTFDRLNSESIFSLKPGRSRAVFLEESSVDNLTLADLQALKQKVFLQMEEKLLAYHASWIRQE